MEEVEQGLGLPVDVDEDEAAPCIDANRAQAHVRRADAGPVAGVDHHLVGAVEVPLPAVVVAVELGGEAAALGDAAAAMGADVEEGADLAGGVAGDEDGFIGDVEGDELAGLAEVFLAGGDQPYAGPHPLLLAPGEFR